MKTDEILKENLLIHLNKEGKPVTWKFHDNAVYYFIEANLCPQSVTLETGMGFSTLIFAICGGYHTAIAPSQQEAKNIRDYLQSRGELKNNLSLICERSERALPRIAGMELDVMLVDGRHGFPAPAIDFFYGASLLKIGGIMIIDDTHLSQVYELVQYMRASTDWQCVKEFNKTIAFRKISDAEYNAEWGGQPFFLALNKDLYFIEIARSVLEMWRSGKKIKAIRRVICELRYLTK